MNAGALEIIRIAMRIIPNSAILVIATVCEHEF